MSLTSCLSSPKILLKKNKLIRWFKMKMILDLIIRNWIFKTMVLVTLRIKKREDTPKEIYLLIVKWKSNSTEELRLIPSSDIISNTKSNTSLKESKMVSSILPKVLLLLKENLILHTIMIPLLKIFLMI